ncbi:MAG: transcription-repair coupling factor [Candidatus Muiribacterium halophilum]|uniref:Transcription-repair-coupling factor n=1 Tax=Muiribacterium halophilum TaxID=2053465 RepID=A0A2N5ZKR7_MUIH1|nr:MAG: transcription-repair coupling factor [Candidatus Muirbacterium halophilum]
MNHGIGIYKGIKKVKVGIVKKEYFHIKYAGNDELYVPIESADHIHKYIGKDKPSLYTLDGKRWKNTKGRVRKKVKSIAKDLIKLYSERMNTKGFVFGSDNDWQHELEASFSYEETQDQVRVMEEIKEYMQSTHPMDRLVCGDVGFGKTELAVRAAFKAVMSSKQVAVLAPTTILVEQHFRTFTERFKMFPVKIAQVSRMQTPAQNRDILEKLKTQEIDLVIGTHKLISDKVKFKDLGLLVVDEEQRFGVSHKEKIKRMKKNIDVLTMTATPIPRTLNMALNGIRDVSVIETAPDNRLPIKTFVIPFSELVLRESIEREVDRGGQVYYLYNNVRNIHMVKARLEKMLPDVNFVVAHGQMNRKDLNHIMDDFLNKRGDVLITTTIIESGIDIPNVNTIIVENAHRFGLSQLYQLKGRVGRSERQAYAYLFYKKDQKLTEAAVKRLQTLRENTDLGSGFKVAMKDLEIRGAGNVFGGEQHGFVDDIGFEMYCKILKEVVAEEKGEMQNEYKEIKFSLPVAAYIPEHFEENRKKKIELYRKIAGVMNEKELKMVQDEIRDNYGKIPKEVSNLLKIQNIKIHGRKVLLSEIIQYSSKTTLLKFYKLEFTEKGLGDFLGRYSPIIDFSVNQENAVAIRVENLDV